MQGVERSQVGESHLAATIIVLSRCAIVLCGRVGSFSVREHALRVDFSTSYCRVIRRRGTLFRDKRHLVRR